jgi:hypothetical protein
MKGISSAPMLLVITCIAFALIRQNNLLSFDAVQMVSIQRTAIQAFYQAQSAINWGLMQTWSMAQNRQCQRNSNIGGWSCLYTLSSRQGILEGCDQQKQIKLWQRVEINSSRTGIIPLANGWIDIDPR